MSNDKWDARAKSERDGESDAYIRGHYDGRDLGRDESKSAYAELAAELEWWKFRAEQLDALATRINDRAEKAESQLAELRGKCEALSTDISEAVEDVARSGGYINSDEAKGWSVELRTLAAADGGGG